MSNEALAQLAGACDIQTSYKDLQGREVRARPESLVAALKAMRVIEDDGDLEQARRRHEREHWHWDMDPVTVVWAGHRAIEQSSRRSVGRLRLRVPEGALAGAAHMRLELEAGGILERPLRLDRAKVTESATIGGKRFVELSIGLPAGMPYGYHRARVEIAGRSLHSWVISAPRKVYAPEGRPEWGAFMPLYALHSKRSWGIGDYTDLRGLIEWAGAKGAGLVATLPLLPTFLDEPFAPSPYEPVSRLFWNEVFIDPEAPLEGGAAPEVDSRLAQEARALLDGRDVDYAAVMALKRRVLETQARGLQPGSYAGRSLASFLASRPEVSDYAAFRAAMEQLGPDWQRWPAPQRRGRLHREDYDEQTARYFKYAQWRAHCQVRDAADAASTRAMRSYLDLPVGVHAQGYDAWRYQDVFARGLTVGAPPDLLATHGQNWGFQPLIPAALRASGYEYMTRYLRHYFASAKMLRIDHAIGLHRLYWIPEGAPARDGVFVRQAAEELYAVLCLESMRYEAVVVAEDLGLVPTEVKTGLRRHGISSMYVQMFEMTGRGRRPQRPTARQSVASFSTHDLPPFASYWQDEDLEQRESLGLLAPEPAVEQQASRSRHREALVAYLQQRGLVTDESDVAQVYRGTTALLAESDAQWVILNLEDTWGETRAQNLPGTTSEQYPNWVTRAAYGLEDFDSVEGLTKALKTVKLYRNADKHPEAMPVRAGIPEPSPAHNEEGG